MSVLSKSAAIFLAALLISSIYSLTPLIVGAAVDTVANDDVLNGTEGQPLIAAAPGVRSNDVLGVGATLITDVTLVTGPSIPGTFVLSNDGSVTFTPTDTNFSGNATFTYTITDNDGFTSAPATVTMTFANENDAPVSANQSVDTYVDIATSSTLSYTDIDASNTFTFATTTDPLHGTLVVDAATGDFTYTPESAYAGSDSFTWEMFDGVASSGPATVTIMVNAAPSAEIGISFIVVSNNGVVATTSDSALFDGATTTGATTTVSTGAHTVTAMPLSGYTTTIGGDCASDGTIALVNGDSKHCVITHTQQGSPSTAPEDEKVVANGPISTALPWAGTITHFTGSVLGASTTTASTTLPELPAGCTPILDEFMRRSDMINNSDQVTKLQRFLNDKLGTRVALSGVFGPETDAAVRAFQNMHADEILKPWGLTKPTGFVYLTTQRWINITNCSTLDIPMPKLVPYIAR